MTDHHAVDCVLACRHHHSRPSSCLHRTLTRQFSTDAVTPYPASGANGTGTGHRRRSVLLPLMCINGNDDKIVVTTVPIACRSRVALPDM